ncbi:MAG: ABC transporter permease [Chloroflexota bacterium]|nr:ABC transporter permease [Chloroflexota bacterium]
MDLANPAGVARPRGVLAVSSRWTGWLRNRTLRQFVRNPGAVAGAVICTVFLVLALAAPLITPHDPYHQSLMLALDPPSADYPLGTDEHGRDILSRLLAGAQVSLFMSLATVALALVVGGGLGLLAGYYRGAPDEVIMRVMDVLLALPGVLLAITIIAILGVGIENVILAVAVSSVPVFARLARASTLSVRESEYVMAARVLGAPDWRMLLRDILPNITAPLIVMSTTRLAAVILTASGLSFLGLGAQPPSPEWGAMLNAGRAQLTSNPHVAVSPGIAIMLIVLGFNLLGDGLRDALDPRLRNS